MILVDNGNRSLPSSRQEDFVTETARTNTFFSTLASTVFANGAKTNKELSHQRLGDPAAREYECLYGSDKRNETHSAQTRESAQRASSHLVASENTPLLLSITGPTANNSNSNNNNNQQNMSLRSISHLATIRCKNSHSFNYDQAPTEDSDDAKANGNGNANKAVNFRFQHSLFHDSVNVQKMSTTHSNTNTHDNNSNVHSEMPAGIGRTANTSGLNGHSAPSLSRSDPSQSSLTTTTLGLDDHADSDLGDHGTSNHNNSDNNERAIANMNNTSIDRWYNNPHQIIAMLSNFSTSYNVVNISLVLLILENVIQSRYGQETSSADAAASASALLAGMIFGQIVGGTLGDVIGRLQALRCVMLLQILASIACASIALPRHDATFHLDDATSISRSVTEDDDDQAIQRFYWTLAIWRFVLGVGAGGVYPLAAVLSAEQGNQSSSSSSIERIVLTFSMQGIGFISVPLVTTALLYIFPHNQNLVWRLVLALGAVPGLLLMIIQLRLYRNAHMEPIAQDDNDDDNMEDGILRTDDDEAPSRGWWNSIRHEPHLFRKFIGTAGTWFLFDVFFYGNALFQPVVVQAAFGGSHEHGTTQDIRQTAIQSLLLNGIALPGYFVASMMLGSSDNATTRSGHGDDSMGPSLSSDGIIESTLSLPSLQQQELSAPTQQSSNNKSGKWLPACCKITTQTPRYVMLQGFASVGVLYFSIGFNWNYLRHTPALLVILYGLTFFFANYGPNTTTFILPSLMYGPECRSTLNGLSAAAGKLGALCGATLFEPIAEEWGDDSVMLICSTLAAVAVVITYFTVPDRHLSA